MFKKWMVYFLSSVGLLFLFVFFETNAVQAGGAFQTNKNGQPTLWNPASTITYNLDPGGLKGAGTDTSGGGGGSGSSGGCSMDQAKAMGLANTDLQGMVATGFKQWTDAVGGDLKIVAGSPLSEDVAWDNAEKFLLGPFLTNDQSAVNLDNCYDNDPNTPCTNPIVFDPHGEIIDAIAGSCARYSIIGLTQIFPKVDNSGNPVTPELRHSEMIINGTCLDPADPVSPPATVHLDACPGYTCPGANGLTVANLQSTITHELGHFLGLDHTLVNKTDYINCVKEPVDAACNLENIPTMIGLYVNDADLNTLHFDDTAIIKRYYSSATQTNSGTCTIKGTVYNTRILANQTPVNEVRCEEVVARQKGNEDQAAGFVSGAQSVRTKTTGSQSDCNFGTAGCGAYSIVGLPPGDYVMGVHNFDDSNGTSSLSSFNIEPCHPPFTGHTDNDPAINEYPPSTNEVTVHCNAGDVRTQDLVTN